MNIPSLTVLGLVAMTCACASDPRGGPPGGRDGPGGPPPMGLRVFVSPFGEPFDATPGQSGLQVWFAAADLDHDGKLTPTEFDADGVRWFLALDTDHDGRIGPGEIAAYEAMINRRLAGAFGGAGGPGGQGGGMRGRPGGGMGGPPPGGGRGGPGGGAASLNDQMGGQDEESHLKPPGSSQPRGYQPAVTPLAMANLLNIPQPVKAADMDINQFITTEEWQRTSARWFSLLDRDRDGVLTLAELPALRGGPGGPGGRPGGGRRPPG